MSNDGKLTVANLRRALEIRLNDHLLTMKPDYDDSIVGFNEAQDIVRETFNDYQDRVYPLAHAAQKGEPKL